MGESSRFAGLVDLERRHVCGNQWQCVAVNVDVVVKVAAAGALVVVVVAAAAAAPTESVGLSSVLVSCSDVAVCLGCWTSVILKKKKRLRLLLSMVWSSEH